MTIETTNKKLTPETGLLDHDTEDSLPIDPTYEELLKQTAVTTNKLELLDPENFDPRATLLYLTTNKLSYKDPLKRFKETVRQRCNLEITDERYLLSLYQAKKGLLDEKAPLEKATLVIAAFLNEYNNWPESDLINKGKLIYHIISITEEIEKELNKLRTIKTPFSDELESLKAKIRKLEPLYNILQKYIDKIPLSDINLCISHYIENIKCLKIAQHVCLANTAAMRLEQGKEQEEAKEILERAVDPTIINMKIKSPKLTEFIFSKTLPIATFKWTIEALKEKNNPILDKIIEFFETIIDKATRNYLTKIDKEEALQIINDKNIGENKLNLTQQSILCNNPSIHQIITEYYPIKYYLSSSPLLQNLLSEYKNHLQNPNLLRTVKTSRST